MGNDFFDDLCDTIEEQTKLLLERDLRIVDLKKQLAIAVAALNEISKGTYGQISYDPPVKKGESVFDKQDIARDALKQIEEMGK